MTANGIKRVLVTGGNRGIGIATAKGLKQLGLDVTIGSRNRAEGEAAVAGTGIACVELDVSDVRSIEAAIATVGPFRRAGQQCRGSVSGADACAARTIRTIHGSDGRRAIPADPRLRAAHDTPRLWPHRQRQFRLGRFCRRHHGARRLRRCQGRAQCADPGAFHQLPPSVKINSMCPGWVSTRMGGSAAPRTPEEGADTAIWLATLPETDRLAASSATGSRSAGRFHFIGVVKAVSALLRSTKLSKRVHNLSTRLMSNRLAFMSRWISSVSKPFRFIFPADQDPIQNRVTRSLLSTECFMISGIWLKVNISVIGIVPQTLNATQKSVENIAPDHFVQHRQKQEEQAPAQCQLASSPRHPA